MTRPVLVTLNGVGKQYDSSFHLKVNELEISAGETLAVLGPTGSGKSTLLNLLAGLEPVTAGEIRVNGCVLPPREMPLSVRRRMAMVHQRPLLLTGSVRENVEYGLRLRRVPRRTSAVTSILDRLRLTHLASQPACTLSGGQVQLVALARALVLEPELLLLDEPTSSLDPAHVALVEDTIRDVRARQPMTVVWATHNLFQARRIADRVAFFWNGNLVEVAATHQFFDAPGEPRTADFVQGKMIY